MKTRWSIGFKIFFLAAFLILTTFVVALFSYNRTAAVNNESKEISEYYLPLTQMLARVDGHVLKQELHFSTILRHYDSNPVDKRLVNRELKRLNAEKKKVDDQLSAFLSLFEEGLNRTDLNLKQSVFEETKPKAQEIKKEHQSLFEHVLKILDALNKSDGESVQALIGLTQEKKDQYNVAIEHLLKHLQSLTLNSSQQADLHEDRVLWFNFLTTLLATFAGLILAFLITKGLVRPIHNLVQGTQKVESGNLNTEVSVTSNDEIGSLTSSFNNMVGGLRLKERIKEIFGKYIDPRIVEQLIHESDRGKLQGQKRKMTVLFSDIKGFTSISENISPDLLVKVLNLYFSFMSKAVSQYDGVIDKYIGDAVMAFWGPPFTSEKDHPKLACFAALEKLVQLDLFREKVKEFFEPGKTVPEIDIRIGIATGDMIVGNVGSEFSQGYTVLGDTVNTSSRLEGVNKVYGTRILINEQTQEMASDFIETREIDSIQVVGKDEPVRIFELMGKKDDLNENTLKLKNLFEKALQAYRNQEWPQARQLFNDCLQIHSNDTPSEVFLDRIAQFEKNPPEESWNGTWRLTKK